MRLRRRCPRLPETALEAVLPGDAPGWFRDAPLDDGAPAPDDLPAPQTEPDVEPGAGPADESVVRDRERPVVIQLPAPVAPVSPSRRRLRGLLIAAATVVVVAAAGFAAGLLLPTLLPGPGIASGSASPTAAATDAPTASSSPTAQPSVVPTTAPTPGPTATPAATPAPTATIYVVKVGDTLQGIANRYGVTLAAIVEANQISNPNIIYKGQKIVIPPKTPAP
jgi:LysM repeat protein